MKKQRIFPWIILCVFFILFGCRNAMQLKYARPAPAPASKGDVAVIVTDAREPQKGGEQPFKVGNARNAFGMPFAINAASNREPTRAIKELVTDCLMAAGYRVVEDGGRAPQLHAVLKTFWSDGYQHSRMIIDVPMELKQAGRSKAAWTYNLNVNTGFTWRSAGYRQFNLGFNKMMETAKDDLLREFTSSGFQKKYQRAM